MNHRNTGDKILDEICNGERIAVGIEEIRAELRRIHGIGCRYYHYHARNFMTREQTTDNSVYRDIGSDALSRHPDLVLSYGASRNGPEVIENISRFGEWERVSHADLPIDAGGAHFITMQAAIELQILRDFEDAGRLVTAEYAQSPAFLADIAGYVPSTRAEDVKLETNSTANGGNYGRSSPAIQLETYAAAVEARRRRGLFDEVEWVQFERSLAMTRFAIEHEAVRLADRGQLNITLLFGFSPKLPFPTSYAEFRAVVAAAKGLERDLETGERRRQVTISVGAAVLPQHAAKAVGPLDVGRDRGRRVTALQRLAAYAAQEDSEVDVLRVGMEDSPYLLSEDGAIRPTSNVELCEVAAEELHRHGVAVLTDGARVAGRLGCAVDVPTEGIGIAAE
ncbi:hypothetical protein GCM10011611_59830 [Aliidongia dinghuensis]|uniref:Uncharacterized protein n=1 Tax=Aliidongia dinghuensis TaxID=1867774 RepID=A0A8J2YZB4_9PROT|nr:hypothetical protein [Aliidongia dinghuensis]GGF45436.1 hypothetical protein GCM10011611_59830 [Aliidongia dinghuensis]